MGIDSLFEEIIMPQQYEEIALRGTLRYLHKFMRKSKEEEEELALKKVAPSMIEFQLISKNTGMLDNLILMETHRRTPGIGEIEIEVKAAGLNFKDVMLAMGLLDENAPKGGYTGYSLGMECSGIVSAVGQGCNSLKKGDRVLAITSGAFSSHAITRSDYVCPIPDSMSFEEASTLPFAFLTAYYSLFHIAHLQAGEKILIHGGAGGVGLAAVRLAKATGAILFATAGNDEKRDYLKKIGVQHVYDSRTLDFAEQILQDTDGSGVDVVLNSLSGSAIYKSLSVLAKYGRFIEIGKTDIYENNTIALRPFWNNLTYSAVDIDKLLSERPEVCAEILTHIMDYSKGQVPEALPYHHFSIDRVQDAFRYLASAKHIGKVLVSMDSDEITVAPDYDIRGYVSADASYIIIGGWSGLGLQCVQWLINKGARHIVIASRSGPLSPEAKDAQRVLAKKANVLDVICDVARKEDTLALFDKIEAAGYPEVKGIINSALVLDDAILPDMTSERFMKAIRPKVMGNWNLHLATVNKKVDFFISFSSVWRNTERQPNPIMLLRTSLWICSHFIEEHMAWLLQQLLGVFWERLVLYPEMIM